MELSLAGAEPAVRARLEAWESADLADRIWRHDFTVWRDSSEEIVDRLGWLQLPETMAPAIDDIEEFGAAARSDGLTHTVVLGMGGSSLAPEVFARTMGCTTLEVLDSTHPDAVSSATARLDLERTLFVVSSKSGTTLETLSLFRHFWRAVADADLDVGRHFAAVTDPGTDLAALGAERGFRRIFTADPNVGGRFSALSHFGLVPAATAGLPAGEILTRAASATEALRPGTPASDNPGLVLGAVLGELALLGRDKVTYACSPTLVAFPDWAEQLLAESTGKEGSGLIPIAADPLPVDRFGSDRVIIAMSIAGEPVPIDLDAARSGAHPVVEIVLGDPLELGAEMLRHELAVATAGAVLDIHPFDQPNVQAAKELARQAMAGDLDVNAGDALGPADGAAVAGFAAEAEGGEYLGIQAYLASDPAIEQGLSQLRARLAEATGAATTVGYGPRFLHSTGQLHKGGSPARFVQLVDSPGATVPVPETDYSFNELIRAQALGDLQALRDAGQQVLRIDLGPDPVQGLHRLVALG